MDRKRIREEVIEILAHKLVKLPPLPFDGGEEEIDYEAQRLNPDITDNHLDLVEVAMDLEDAFGINFEDRLPGDESLETIGAIIDFIEQRVLLAAKPKKPASDE